MTIPSPDDIRSKVSAFAFGNPLVQNDFRGIVVEVIVGCALESLWRWCSGDWCGWDFEHPDSTRLEVKQSAARQTWNAPKKPSPPTFDIRARTGYYAGAEWHPGKGRLAHIYAFAYHPIADANADLRDPRQWQFHVVRAGQLPLKKTIGLARVRAISPAVPWTGLSNAVEVIRLERVGMS
jgi:hypothetical protein